MWAALIIIILVCGYNYTKCHLPSRYRQNRAVGWNAYFDVALKGGEFLLNGVFFSSLLFIILFSLMFILNIPAYFMDEYNKFTFASDFWDVRVFGLGMFSAVCVGWAVVASYIQSSKAKKDYLNPKKRVEIFREIAAHSAIENILLESIEHGLLLLVTLKSRKVYVGMIDEARFNQLDTNTLVLIPFMSGYRHKDTLTYCVEHNYVDHYSSQGITLTSEPLSVYQFRHVLPFDQIESFSLFDVNTYDTFQEVIKQKKELDNAPEES